MSWLLMGREVEKRGVESVVEQSRAESKSVERREEGVPSERDHSAGSKLGWGRSGYWFAPELDLQCNQIFFLVY